MSEVNAAVECFYVRFNLTKALKIGVMQESFGGFIHAIDGQRQRKNVGQPVAERIFPADDLILVVAVRSGVAGVVIGPDGEAIIHRYIARNQAIQRP